MCDYLHNLTFVTNKTTIVRRQRDTQKNRLRVLSSETIRISLPSFYGGTDKVSIATTHQESSTLQSYDRHRQATQKSGTPSEYI